jgi:chaperonin GroES
VLTTRLAPHSAPALLSRILNIQQDWLTGLRVRAIGCVHQNRRRKISLPNYSELANLFQGEGKAMAKTSFTPLHDRILVRRVEEGESIRGGIIIPDSAKEKPQQGEVLAVGKGKSNDEGKVFPLDVKAGDSILFGKYSGTEIKLDGEELLIMREEEVLGILKK